MPPQPRRIVSCRRADADKFRRFTTLIPEDNAMTVNRRWVERDLGFDPVSRPAPASTFKVAAAAREADPEIFSEKLSTSIPRGRRKGVPGVHHGDRALPIHRYTVAERARAEDWTREPGKGTGGALPNADVLVVTWTVDEGHALSRVLTPGKDSRNDYLAYTHNFAKISQENARRLPGASGEATGRVLDHEDRQERASWCSSRIRICRRTGRSFRTSMCGANHRRGEAETRDHHRHRGRDRQAV